VTYRVQAVAADATPRYQAYALAHGRTSPAMLDADRADWPGGCMAGFQLWMSQRWAQWARKRGYQRTASGRSDTLIGPAEHADFDQWLAQYAKAESELHPEPRSSKETTKR
jgi:hypothetical protein